LLIWLIFLICGLISFMNYNLFYPNINILYILIPGVASFLGFFSCIFLFIFDPEKREKEMCIKIIKWIKK
jgi:hypothetical protein